MTLLRAEIDELKEQLQVKEKELFQKDAELSTVQVQLRDCESSFQTFQVCLSSQHVLAIVQIAILILLIFSFRPNWDYHSNLVGSSAVTCHLQCTVTQTLSH